MIAPENFCHSNKDLINLFGSPQHFYWCVRNAFLLRRQYHTTASQDIFIRDGTIVLCISSIFYGLNQKAHVTWSLGGRGRTRFCLQHSTVSQSKFSFGLCVYTASLEATMSVQELSFSSFTIDWSVLSRPFCIIDDCNSLKQASG